MKNKMDKLIISKKTAAHELRAPVSIGDTVYSVIQLDCPPEIEAWEVAGIGYYNDKWWAFAPDGKIFELDDPDGFTYSTLQAAQNALNKKVVAYDV